VVLAGIHGLTAQTLLHLLLVQKVAAAELLALEDQLDRGVHPAPVLVI
jgi:hypothetical protein